MNHLNRFIVLIGLMIVGQSNFWIVNDGTADPGESNDPALAQRLEWFQNLKFGLFLHWGAYSQWGCIEST